GVDREVLTHISEERRDRHVRCPVRVVLDNGARRGLIEIDEGLQLPANAASPVGDSVLAMQVALTGVPGVADQTGRTTSQNNRLVTCELESAQRQNGDQTASVQARSRGVESAIEGERPAVQFASEFVDIGGLRDQTAPGQLVKDVLAHA